MQAAEANRARTTEGNNVAAAAIGVRGRSNTTPGDSAHGGGIGAWFRGNNANQNTAPAADGGNGNVAGDVGGGGWWPGWGRGAGNKPASPVQEQVAALREMGFTEVCSKTLQSLLATLYTHAYVRYRVFGLVACNAVRHRLIRNCEHTSFDWMTCSHTLRSFQLRL